MINKVVLPFSGGMDSTVLLFKATELFDEIHTISFNYSQRHKKELDNIEFQINSAKNRSAKVVTNKIIDVSFIKDIAPTSSLTNLNIPNPSIKEMVGEAQPTTYVPYRNMMFTSIACSYAEGIGAKTVWYGCAQADSLGGMWDGADSYVKAMNDVIILNRSHKIILETPLIDKSKKEIVEEGVRLGVDFGRTWTCYANREDGLADATTPSSSLRLRGFIEAKYKDPVQYVQQGLLEDKYKAAGCRIIQ